MNWFIDALVQDYGNSSELAMGSLQSYTKPLLCEWWLISIPCFPVLLTQNPVYVDETNNKLDFNGFRNIVEITCQKSWGIDLLHKSDNAPVLHSTMRTFLLQMVHCGHCGIFVK